MSAAARCLMCDTDERVLRMVRSDGTVTHSCLDHYELVLADFRQWPGEPILCLPTRRRQQ